MILKHVNNVFFIGVYFNDFETCKYVFSVGIALVDCETCQ